MKPSKYQQDIFGAVITKTNDVAVEATAGSGKTTTIVEAAKLIPYGKKSIFVAFNKGIVIELKSKLPVGVECSTMHSVGCRSIFNHYPGDNNKINKDKQKFLIEPYFDKEKNMRKKWSAIYAVDRILSLARATMTPITKEAIEKLANDYALDYTTEHINVAVKAYKKLREEDLDPNKYNISIDFQNMIELCVINEEIRMPQYDYVFVDEAQDLSKLDQLFIERLVKKPRGRKIIVGDPNQSIYGFRGSDPNSFEVFTSNANTVKLPLSISYRCSKAVVRKAQEVYSNIEPCETNEEGKVVEKGKIEDIQEGDFVLCRNTRPLIELFFQLLEMDKKAYVVGKEVEKGLLGLLSQFDSLRSTKDATEDLDGILERLGEELKKKGILNPVNHPKYGIMLEKVQILRLLFRKFDTIEQVETFIEDVFNDDEREGIQLMTIHKSKGLENRKVFVIEKFEGRELIPSTYAITADQLKQERNLRFVAYTRAKSELVLLSL